MKPFTVTLNSLRCLKAAEPGICVVLHQSWYWMWLGCYSGKKNFNGVSMPVAAEFPSEAMEAAGCLIPTLPLKRILRASIGPDQERFLRNGAGRGTVAGISFQPERPDDRVNALVLLNLSDTKHETSIDFATSRRTFFDTVKKELIMDLRSAEEQFVVSVFCSSEYDDTEPVRQSGPIHWNECLVVLAPGEAIEVRVQFKDRNRKDEIYLLRFDGNQLQVS